MQRVLAYAVGNGTLSQKPKHAIILCMASREQGARKFRETGQYRK